MKVWTARPTDLTAIHKGATRIYPVMPLAPQDDVHTDDSDATPPPPSDEDRRADSEDDSASSDDGIVDEDW